MQKSPSVQVILLLAARNASGRPRGSSHSHGVRFELEKVQMLNRRRLCRRKCKKHTDGSIRAGEIELTPQPVFCNHRTGGAILANDRLKLLKLGAPLRDRRIDE